MEKPIVDRWIERKAQKKEDGYYLVHKDGVTKRGPYNTEASAQRSCLEAVGYHWEEAQEHGWSLKKEGAQEAYTDQLRGKTAKDIQYNRDKGERKKYQQGPKGLDVGDTVKVNRSYKDLTVGDMGVIKTIQPQPDFGDTLFANVETNGMTFSAPLSYLDKVVVDLPKAAVGAQEDYAAKLKGKIDKEATIFDQERWSNPGKRPGGIYRSAKTAQRSNWGQAAQDDAKEFIRDYAETIKEQIIEKGEASTDLNNDYDNGDSYIHESYTDKEYNLQEAAELLDQLSDHEETDRGLWEGQDPRQAISTQAAFTYSNAVVHYIIEYISNINNAVGGEEGADVVELEIYKEVGEMPPTATPAQPQKPDTGGIAPLEQFGQAKVGQVTEEPTEWYIANSSIWDTPPYYSDLQDKMIEAVERVGGYDVHLENKYGWENQPEVIVFMTDNVGTAVKVEDEVNKIVKPVKRWGVIIHQLDDGWDDRKPRSGITPLEKFGHCPQLGTKKKEGKMDLNKVIVDLWDRGVIGDKKVEALQRTPNRRLVQSELVKIAKTNGLGDVLKVLADNTDGKVETDDRRGYPEGNREETTNQPSAEGKEQRLPGVAEPADKGVSPTGKENRLPGVKEPAKTPWDGWKRKYEERENDIKDSKPGASAGGTDERLPGVAEGEHSPKGPYPGTHYGKKVDELNACIKAQDFVGIARVAKELEEMKKEGQHRTPFEISKDQKERDRKIEGAPHEPKISPSPQTSLGDPEHKVHEQAHGKTTDSLDTKGEVNPSPAVDSVKGTPDKLGNPESQIDLSKSLRGMFTGVDEDSEGKGETKEGQLEDFHLENKGEPKFEWTTIPGETDQEPRTIKTTPDLTEQKSTAVPGIGKGEDNQPPGKGALAVKCKACKTEMVLSAADEKVWLDLGKTICKCGNLIEAEVDMKIDTDMFSGAPKVADMEVQSLGNKKTAKKKAKKAQVNWVKTAAQKGESVLDRFFRIADNGKKECPECGKLMTKQEDGTYTCGCGCRRGQITIDDKLPEVGAAPDRKEEDEAHDYDKEYKDKFLKDTKPQKGKQKSDDHDYKGPVEDTLKDSPKPLETQKDREKELKKGQLDSFPDAVPAAVGGAGTGGPNDDDCPLCGAEWDEDTLAEYGDMGEVDCPDCGEHVSSFDKEGQKKDDGRGSKTPERVKELAEDLKGKAEEPYGLATHIMEKERRKVPHRGPEDGRKLKYEEVKKLPREGRVAIFDNGGKSEDRYFVVVGTKAYTITNSGVGTFIGDARKFDLTHIVKATKRVATKDVPVRVQRAIFRRVVGTRRGQLSETDPMQMTTGKPTSEIEKIKPTRKPVDEPLDVVMTPSIERSKGAGTPIDPTYLAETIVRGLRYSHYHTAQEGFNHIIRATKDITSDQIEKLQGLMKELGYDVSEQKGDIVKTGQVQ